MSCEFYPARPCLLDYAHPDICYLNIVAAATAPVETEEQQKTREALQASLFIARELDLARVVFRVWLIERVRIWKLGSNSSVVVDILVRSLFLMTWLEGCRRNAIGRLTDSCLDCFGCSNEQSVTVWNAALSDSCSSSAAVMPVRSPSEEVSGR